MPFSRLSTILLVVCAVVTIALNANAARPPKGPPPDLTKGGQPDERHDWLLGPTGARGWMAGHNLETLHARQIIITRVDKGSPADGVLEVGDVIVGLDGNPFGNDPRVLFGNAITEAEEAENKGQLNLLVWRDGKVSDRKLKLAVLGSYSETSPWDCEKSRKIVDAGCRWIAENMRGGIPGQINALALLASGKPEYKKLVRDYARQLASPGLKVDVLTGEGMKAWSWGYSNLLLTEYYLATGDKYVLPAIKKFSSGIARGQSCVGTWGHGMAWPSVNNGQLHGKLGGYGALNQAGLVCHQSLVLAKKCGVKDIEVQTAITKANDFFKFYVGKGAIPYGDHRPSWTVHDDNGKNSIATLTFDIQNKDDATRFFSRMVVASYDERERGHTGNYFSFLWGPLAANRAGPEAAAAFLNKQRWFYDMNRSWRGSYPYQGGAGMGGGEHQYGNWDCTGAFVLAHLLPQKKLYMTGRDTRPDNLLTGKKLKETVSAGVGFDSWNMGAKFYGSKTNKELFQLLGSWSPAVRFRAASALGKKTDVPVTEVTELLKSGSPEERYGAAMTLGAMGGRGEPGVALLAEALESKDLWLRIRATDALADIGAGARPAVPALLKLAAREDPSDPRGMTQRYVSVALFYRGGALGTAGLLARDIENIDKAALFAAVKNLLKNPDGRTRGAVGTVYEKLTYEEIKPLLPAIYEAVKYSAPSGVMFADGIRLRGIQLLARHHIREGMPLCLEIIDINRWGKRHRIVGCLKTLQQYGTAARPLLPQLKEVEQKLLQHREAKGLAPSIELVRQIMQDVQKNDPPVKLRSIKD